MLQVCIINKTPLTLSVPCGRLQERAAASGPGPNLTAGNRENLISEFGLKLEAMCNMSLPIYPQVPPGSQPWLIQFSLSFSSGPARVPPQTGVIS